MKKFVAFFLAALFLLASVAMAEDAPVQVAALKGPTAMGMVKLMDEEENGGSYQFTIAASADLLTPDLVQGKIDIACVPANLASVLYNKTHGGITVLAVNTLGVLYIVERGDTIHTVEDLRGRTIYSSGKGASPEYALNYILSANGLDVQKDVTVEYKAEHTECLSALLADENAVALLPQPFVTVAMGKSEDIHIALDLTKEWDAVQPDDAAASCMITGVVIARTAFVQENPEKVNAFLESYGASVQFVNENVEQAAQLVGKYDIVTAAVAEKALPYCNIVCITGAEMQQKLSGYLSVLYAAEPASVGGSLPEDAFYYVAQ